MNIENVRPERLGAAGEVKRSESAQPALRPAQPARSVERSDRVEISDAGRDLALQQLGRPQRQSPLSAARVTELRERVASGFYDAPEIVAHTAQRILDSGELALGGGGQP